MKHSNRIALGALATLTALAAMGCSRSEATEGSPTSSEASPKAASPTKAAAAETNAKGGLFIDIDDTGVLLEQDNKVKGDFEVRRGSKKVAGASVQINGATVPNGERDLTMSYGKGLDVPGAAPGAKLKVKATEGSDSAELEVTCPTEVTMSVVEAGPVAPGDQLTVKLAGRLKYDNREASVTVGPSRKGMLVTASMDSKGQTARLAGSETQVSLTVPRATSNYSHFTVTLRVPGDKVKTTQGAGFCQLVRKIDLAKK